MKINSFLIVLLFLIASTVYSRSPRQESFVVHNHSSQTVIIAKEFSDASINYNPEIRRWRQNLFGLVTYIRPALFEASEIKLLPGRAISVVAYDPVASVLDTITFIDVMRSIFNSLRISTADGRTVITLDTLEEHIRRQVFPSGPAYILEIRD